MIGRAVRQDEPDAVETWVRDAGELPVAFSEQLGDAEMVLDIGVVRWETSGSWQWTIHSSAMEFVREDPLLSRVRRAMIDRVEALLGVIEVRDQDTETWIVDGAPSGSEVLVTAAEVIDDFALEIAEHVRLQESRHSSTTRSSSGLHAVTDYGGWWECSCGAGGRDLTWTESDRQAAAHSREMRFSAP
ncbi:MAG: hypothetical protein Q7V88_03700 [Actinomycetota bacterium]|nr:hypothetical protein [Actinomycetota bacterium]